MIESSARPGRPTDTSINAGPIPRDPEADWIAASRQGDGLAFNRLVLKWEKQVYNLVFRMVHSREEAAEVTQEVFMSAFKHIHRFRHDARFSTWLYRIAVNHCISRLRSRPPGLHYSLDQEAGIDLIGRIKPVESHEKELAREECRTHVRKALRSLTPEQQAVVELKFFQELTFDEIAAIVQAPLSTVKSRLYSGLETLKTRLGHLGIAERTEATP